MGKNVSCQFTEEERRLLGTGMRSEAQKPHSQLYPEPSHQDVHAACSELAVRTAAHQHEMPQSTEWKTVRHTGISKD